MNKEKRCHHCKLTKPLKAFAKDKHTTDGKSCYCKECSNEESRIDYENHSLRWKNAELKRQYGMTLSEYDILLRTQKGVCAICGNINRNGNKLSVDHDHNTGEIRGLLCYRCNSALSLMRDNPRTLRDAADYLDGI